MQIQRVKHQHIDIDQDGAVLVEAVLAVPLIFLIIYGIFSLCMLTLTISMAQRDVAVCLVHSFAVPLERSSAITPRQLVWNSDSNERRSIARQIAGNRYFDFSNLAERHIVNSCGGVVTQNEKIFFMASGSGTTNHATAHVVLRDNPYAGLSSSSTIRSDLVSMRLER
ncbi:MAG: pilus assembly protein, partial [Bdellovibrionales bacterium]|nr:pilus assembly protein [Bdellovibrionales bacterium]